MDTQKAPRGDPGGGCRGWRRDEEDHDSAGRVGKHAHEQVDVEGREEALREPGHPVPGPEHRWVVL